jgi:hypothetical protein
LVPHVGDLQGGTPPSDTPDELAPFPRPGFQSTSSLIQNWPKWRMRSMSRT